MRSKAKSRRIIRTRSKILGRPGRARMTVYKSLKHVSVQIVDDIKGETLVSYSDFKLEKDDSLTKTQKAYQVGKKIAEIAKTKKIEKVVFDRGGYPYHGRIEALAKGAREGGLIF